MVNTNKHLFIKEEQQGFVEILKQILDKELKPRVRELDEREEFPMDVFQKLYEAGFFGMELPEEYGGLGIDNETSFILNEEIAWYDPGFAFSFHVASAVSKVIFRAGPDELKRNVADMILAGKIGAMCITEAEAGSDAGATRTTAVRNGNEYVLNGVKTFISNGSIADYFIVVATVDRNLKHKGITLFFVERCCDGVKVGKKEDKMGLRLSETNEVIFEDVRIPVSNRIDEEGRGFKHIMQDMEEVRPMAMTYALGLAQRALDEAVAYAKVRKTFGQPIINYQGLSFMMADMQMKIHMARAALASIARAMDRGISTEGYSASSKIFVSDIAMQVAVDAVQVLGGYGYMKDYPVEKLMRDAKIFQIFEGTNQIQQLVLSRLLSAE